MTDAQVKQMWEEGQRDELTMLLKGIAVTIAERLYVRSMKNTDVELDDVVSWALEFMWRAIESWDPEMEVPLRGWIAFRVERDIKNVQRSMKRKKRGSEFARLPFDVLEDRGDTLTVACINKVLAITMQETKARENAALAAIDLERVRTALKALPEYQLEILERLTAGESLRSIGRAMDISHEWVRREAATARACLKEYLE